MIERYQIKDGERFVLQPEAHTTIEHKYAELRRHIDLETERNDYVAPVQLMILGNTIVMTCEFGHDVWEWREEL